MQILDSFETVNNRRELHILTLEEGQVFIGDKKRVAINITKEDRPFMNKLEKLVPVTTTVDIYKYLFNDEVFNNKYEKLLNMIDENEIFKKSNFSVYEDARREHLKQKYRWESCTNIKGAAINYKDSTAKVKCEHENFWVTETYARQVIKKLEEGEFNEMYS